MKRTRIMIAAIVITVVIVGAGLRAILASQDNNGIGGSVSSMFLDKTLSVTWSLTEDPWPASRSYHAMAYDVDNDRVVLFGGWAGASTNETWTFDLNANGWSRMYPAVSPSARDVSAMAYDAQSRRVILFGGSSGGGETWAYDSGTDTWTNMAPATAPPSRLGAQMVYDSEFDRIILFGGHNDELLGDTWVYDDESNTWTAMAPASDKPPPRFCQAMAYDAESHRTVLFGGDPGTGLTPGDDFSDTWTYDFANNIWTNMNPPEAPAGKAFASAAYDSESDRIVLFGGSNKPEETCMYNLNANAWTVSVVSYRPSNRAAHAMAYDSESDRTVLFGGSWPVGIVSSPSIRHNNETWSYDFNANNWTLLSPIPDTISPTIALTSPAEGTILRSASVTVSGTASDNVGIAKVEVSLDNATWIVADGTTSWTANLSLAEGKNTIYVRVTDTSGNTATSTIHVTVPAQGIPVWVWAAMAVGIAGAAVAAYVMIRRRKKEQ